MPSEEEIQNMRARWKPRAAGGCNGDFITIITYSAYSRSYSDPNAPEYLLDVNADNIELGNAILGALRHSRFLTLDQQLALDNKVLACYDQWVNDLMNKYGYKTKGALFKRMKNCDIDLKDGVIKIEPSRHVKLEVWDGDGFTESDYIKIPADSPPEQIGAALRLAFSRCTGMGAD